MAKGMRLVKLAKSLCLFMAMFIASVAACFAAVIEVRNNEGEVVYAYDNSENTITRGDIVWQVRNSQGMHGGPFREFVQGIYLRGLREPVAYLTGLEDISCSESCLFFLINLFKERIFTFSFVDSVSCTVNASARPVFATDAMDERTNRPISDTAVFKLRVGTVYYLPSM